METDKDGIQFVVFSAEDSFIHKNTLKIQLQSTHNQFVTARCFERQRGREILLICSLFTDRCSIRRMHGHHWSLTHKGR